MDIQQLSDMEGLLSRAEKEVRWCRIFLQRTKTEEHASIRDLYSSLVQRSMDSYNAIMDEIETIHASNFTV